MLLPLLAAAVPLITAPVTDHADVIDAVVEAELDASLRELRAATGVQMAVLTVQRIPSGDSLESFSLSTAEQWAGGSERDDGALLVLAISDRRSRLELGYGLEGYITDAEAAGILHRAIADLRDDEVGAASLGIVRDVRGQVSGLRPGPTIPVHRQAMAMAGRLVPQGPLLNVWFSVLGALGLGGFMLANTRPEHSPWAKRLPRARWIAIAGICWVALSWPVLAHFISVPVWRVLVGLLAGAAVALPIGLAGERKLLNGALVVGALALAAMSVAAWALKPSDEPSLWGMGIALGWVAPLFIAVGGWRGSGGSGGSGSGGGGWSESTSSSSSSSPSSGSSGSNSSGGDDWGGGGGSFGGGGASSGW